MIPTSHLADLGVDLQNVEVLIEFANGLMPFLLLKAQFRAHGSFLYCSPRPTKHLMHINRCEWSVLSGIGLENVPREGKGMIGLLGEWALVERHAYKG